jgi:transcriptional regulator with XRE-family HTH domain
VSERDHITGRQIAAARTLLGVSQTELANQARVSIATLRRMEGTEGAAAGMPNNVASVQRALEERGVVFIPENGGGAGVRLAKPSAPV